MPWHNLNVVAEWRDQISVLIEVAVAMLLGAALGFEREAAGKPAGFRTQMLIAGTAAVLVGLSRVVTARFHDMFPLGMARADPVRVIQAIILGISFLCAGTIFRRREKDAVEGLTTAATVILAASIGIACALDQFIIAVGVTILGLIVLRLLSWPFVHRR